ncbi:class F sortase [Candidatus Saccharibacteria bacterium]|nr:class F sortase [Candidatus Saccharibacteria bacterium]
MTILTMSLKIKLGWKETVKWVAWSLLFLVIAIFFVRVATWEDYYYREKEGSERAITEDVLEEVELEEVEPTEQEVKEYKVAADRPRYLSIEKLGINKARVLPVGVNASGELGTPNNIFDVGWYDASGKPGEGKTMLIDGHNGGPNVYGVFKKTPDLVDGDIIVVERGDGEIFKYSVVENIAVSLDESDNYMATALKSPEVGKESLTLITCTGEWSQTQKTYLSRQFTRAIIVKD